MTPTRPTKGELTFRALGSESSLLAIALLLGERSGVDVNALAEEAAVVVVLAFVLELTPLAEEALVAVAARHDVLPAAAAVLAVVIAL